MTSLDEVTSDCVSCPETVSVEVVVDRGVALVVVV